MSELTQEKRSQILTTTAICPSCHSVNNVATGQIGSLQGSATSKIRWVQCHACQETYDVVERNYYRQELDDEQARGT